MNGLTPPKSGAAEWPPGPTPRASRGAPEPSDAFAGLLDSQKARTATAEGQNRSPKTDGQKHRDDDGPVANERAEARSNARWARERREADGAEREHPVQHHEDDAQAKPADSVENEAPVVAPVVTAASAPVAEVPALPETQTQTQTQAPVAPVAQAPVVEAQRPVVQTPVQPDQPEQVQPTQQQPVVQAEEAATPVAPQPEQADAQPVADKAVPQVAPAKPKQAQPDAGQNGGQSGQQGSLPQPAAEQARTVAQAYGRTAQPHASNEVPTTAQSGTPAAPVATPVAAGQPAAARGELAPPTPVPLSRAAETVEHIMRLASGRGVTHARIALNPESLGSIDVHMRHTADGIVAKLVAHAPEAVQQLQQAAADLRQQLEGQGVNLLSLDIGQSAADEGFAARAGSGFGDEGRDGSGSRTDGGDDAAAADAEQTVKSTLQLPDGVLVDVLA